MTDFLVLTVSSPGKYFYYSHLKGETETPGGQEMYPKVTGRERGNTGIWFLSILICGCLLSPKVSLSTLIHVILVWMRNSVFFIINVMLYTPTQKHTLWHTKYNILGIWCKPTLKMMPGDTRLEAQGSWWQFRGGGHHASYYIPRPGVRGPEMQEAAPHLSWEKLTIARAQIVCSNVNTADEGAFLEKLARCKSLFLWWAQLHLNQMTRIVLRVSTENSKSVPRHREALGSHWKRKLKFFPLLTWEKGKIFLKRFLFTKINIRNLAYSQNSGGKKWQVSFLFIQPFRGLSFPRVCQRHGSVPRLPASSWASRPVATAASPTAPPVNQRCVVGCPRPQPDPRLPPPHPEPARPTLSCLSYVIPLSQLLSLHLGHSLDGSLLWTPHTYPPASLMNLLPTYNGTHPCFSPTASPRLGLQSPSQDSRDWFLTLLSGRAPVPL